MCDSHVSTGNTLYFAHPLPSFLPPLPLLSSPLLSFVSSPSAVSHLTAFFSHASADEHIEQVQEGRLISFVSNVLSPPTGSAVQVRRDADTPAGRELRTAVGSAGIIGDTVLGQCETWVSVSFETRI